MAKLSITLCCLLSVALLGADQPGNTQRVAMSRQAMGGVFTVIAYGSDRDSVEAAVNSALAEADRLDHFRGLWQRDPLLALVMLGLMFSTAGVPPFIGFSAKLRIFQVLWETNHLWLVVIAAVMSVVGAFYYLRVVKLMYFDAPPDNLPATLRPHGARLALGLNAAAVLALGILPGPLLDLCGRLIR